jgi:ribosomal protein S18 acetylase RimI-like enzyme
VEYSYHEFRETGFSPILAGDFYCEEDGEEEEHCYLFGDDDDDDDEELQDQPCGGGGGGVLHRRATGGFFRRPASRGADGAGASGGGEGGAGGRHGDKLYVTGVMTAACCRRQGLGASLLQAVEEHARVLRTPYICMFVEPGNAPALALYTQRAGFNLVPYSPTAEVFAAKIGLYKGPYAARQYAFVYKRLELKAEEKKERTQASSSRSSGGGGGGNWLLGDVHAAALPFPGRMPALASPFFP